MTINESFERLKAIEADARNALQPVVFLLDDLVAQPDDLTSDDLAGARESLQRVISALSLARAEIESLRIAIAFGVRPRCTAIHSTDQHRWRCTREQHDLDVEKVDMGHVYDWTTPEEL